MFDDVEVQMIIFEQGFGNKTIFFAGFDPVQCIGDLSFGHKNKTPANIAGVCLRRGINYLLTTNLTVSLPKLVFNVTK